MKRTCTIERGRPHVSLTGITKSEQAALERACDDFLDSTNHKHATNLIKLIRDEVGQGGLSPAVIEKLSRWCDSGAAYANSVAPARHISQLLLGLKLPRLINPGNVRVSDYAAKVKNIAKRINGGS